MTNLATEQRTNLIQQMLIESANQLLRKLEAVGKVPHDATVGELRETAIASSLQQLLPTGFEVCSGFVTDAYGTISPQLDIVVFQRGVVSPLFLQHKDAVIPFEAFKFAIEVKSTLKTSDFKQLKVQSDSIAEMWNSTFMPQRVGGVNSTTLTFKKGTPPLLVIAYDNKVAEATLFELLDKSPNIAGIFIIKQGCFIRSPAGLVSAPEAKTDIERILFAWSTISNACLDLRPFVTVDEAQMENLKVLFEKNRPELSLSDPNVLERIFTPSVTPYLYPHTLQPKDDDTT